MTLDFLKKLQSYYKGKGVNWRLYNGYSHRNSYLVESCSVSKKIKERYIEKVEWMFLPLKKKYLLTFIIIVPNKTENYSTNEKFYSIAIEHHVKTYFGNKFEVNVELVVFSPPLLDSTPELSQH